MLVESRFECGLRIRVLSVSAERDESRANPRTFLTNLTRDVEAAHDGKTKIDQRQIGPHLFDNRGAVAPVLCRDDGDATGLEEKLHHQPGIGLIFNNDGVMYAWPR